MLRRSGRLVFRHQIAESRMHSYFVEGSRRSLRQRFSQLPAWKKVAISAMTPVVSFGAYVGVCTVVHRMHRPVIDSMFDEAHSEEYVMEDWAHVEPTLRPGDVVLLMGTGIMSWKIANTQFVLSAMKAASIRYSHVAVVVQPAELVETQSTSSSSNTGDSRSRRNIVTSSGSANVVAAPPRIRRGAMMMEAVDNKDVNCPDWRGIVRHDCVQVVEVSKRVYGKQGERPCYHRFAIRRLQGFEWTPQRQEQLAAFIAAHEGQPMDKNPALMIAFIWPKLYDRLQIRKGPVISCSELIAEMYKAVGVIQRRTQWQHDTDHTGAFAVNEKPYDFKRSLEIAPCHFAQGLEVGALDFAPGVTLGPEVRIPMPRPAPEMLYTE